MRTSERFDRDSRKKIRPQPKVLILCEDTKSGREYLEDVADHFRVRLDIDILHCGNTDPRGIVEEAISRSHKYDNVFCAIDRDTHLNFDEAIRLAADHSKLDVVVSYPCFEFWLLLHFGFCRKPYSRTGKYSPADLVAKDLRKNPGMDQYAKGECKGVFASLLDRFTSARTTASRVLVQARNDQELNPSTRLHELIDFIEGMSP